MAFYYFDRYYIYYKIVHKRGFAECSFTTDWIWRLSVDKINCLSDEDYDKICKEDEELKHCNSFLLNIIQVE
ncbi:MAG: hypothetical protein LBD84_01695 [Campylobacteraceae bacterium]|nr:hypothetical protein [Campylobacteraceae bacterium]